MCTNNPVPQCTDCRTGKVSRLGMAARKSLRPALAWGLHGVGGAESGTGGVMTWCNTRAGMKIVCKSACPARGNGALWPPRRMVEETGVLVGGKNSHAAGLDRRGGRRRDQGWARVSFAVRSFAGVVIVARFFLHGWGPCEIPVAVA